MIHPFSDCSLCPLKAAFRFCCMYGVSALPAEPVLAHGGRGCLAWSGCCLLLSEFWFQLLTGMLPFLPPPCHLPLLPPPPAPPGQWRILVDSVWLGPDPWEQRVVQGALVKIPGATLSHREVATCGISSSWVMLTPCSILVSQAWKWVTRFGIFILSSPAPRYTQPSALGS